MSKSKALAKSDMLEIEFGPVDEKFALYPNERIRALQMSCSCGSQVLGQKHSGFLPFDHV